jgi:hypothetical protein
LNFGGTVPQVLGVLRRWLPVSASCYRAFGLDLVSEVELPGLSRHSQSDSPSLAIRLAAADAVSSAWSGPADLPVWRSRTQEGRPVSGELGRAGDFLLSCDGAGDYLLSADRRSLMCAPVDPSSGEWRRFLLDTCLLSTALLAGATALHASAVAGPSGAIAFAAGEGVGKTSVAAEFLRRGYELVADDILVVERAAHGYLAHPGPAVMNLPASSFWGGRPLGRVLGMFGEEVWVEIAARVTQAVPLRAIVLFQSREGPEAACALARASALDVLPHARGFNFTPEAELEAFTRMSDLAEEVPLYRLTTDRTHVAAELADAVEDAVVLNADTSLQVVR